MSDLDFKVSAWDCRQMGDNLIRTIHYYIFSNLLLERTGLVDRLVRANSMVMACGHWGMEKSEKKRLGDK